ncbi:MFS transporter [Paremcibacter congregatus]|uniref:MFS transporter n=2 Tax=Paremcibacter congregatus TaxID=2043170 RepID=A0A2G4YSW2_9PROT|nr:MFS transporter [Paremcibacter congregatus]PHZ85414.1 MFS transporter [Paremcibacter congregatus]QDE27939.1 SLC45 family MFS transporter [Paremcibacter congregatus]
MKSKPQLSFWQIWNMCFGFLGIQFGFALQNSNVSRIFQTLGADIDDIPILWVAAPLTGLLVQPIIGYMSDKTWNRLGRRRPYFLIGAVLATLALFVMPNSPYLWVAAGMLWIMDASINIAMEPFRAFVGDMLPNRQRTMGYAMQSFFIGVASVVASALPWMLTNWFDFSNVAPEGGIPQTVIYSFYLGGAALLVAVLWTIFTTKEYSPEELAAFEKAVQADEPDATRTATRSPKTYRQQGALWLLAGAIFTAAIYGLSWDAQLYLLSLGGMAFGVMQIVSGGLQTRGHTDNGFYQIVDDLFHMPRAMQQLAVVQFFSWFALFSLWIYTTPAVTSFHYGSTDPTSALYNEGADWVGILFAAYNGFAALAAFLIPVVARLTNRKIAHMINLSLGGVGLISMLFIADPALLWLPMIGVGIAWASILSMPYSLLSSAVPARKMGLYMGIFNFFIVIPQIMAASVLGLLVKQLFGGAPIYALVLGGACMIVAGIATLRVEDRG